VTSPLPKAPETVMTKGMSITVTNKTGVMTITAGNNYERYYNWEGATRSQVLIPRTERWAGRFGIGTSGAIENHNTITRANLEEEQLHFKSLDDALLFLNHRSRMDGNTIYNDEGLMITWKKAIHPDLNRKSGNVLIVTVYQVYINGDKPSKLPGSQNKKIVIGHNNPI
jgi:hypothetical protein